MPVVQNRIKHKTLYSTIKNPTQGMILQWPNIRLEVSKVMEEVKKNITQSLVENYENIFGEDSLFSCHF